MAEVIVKEESVEEFFNSAITKEQCKGTDDCGRLKFDKLKWGDLRTKREFQISQTRTTPKVQLGDEIKILESNEDCYSNFNTTSTYVYLIEPFDDVQFKMTLIQHDINAISTIL